jgi:hypothetical protein
VLIASPELLPGLKDRGEFGDVLAFSDAEALRALDVITRQRPTLVALEQLFAATSRGAALINRIKADPALNACEIRIVAQDATTRTGRRTHETTTAAPAAVAEAPAAPLDQRGTRRAPRADIADGVEVLVDGNPASLIDLSAVGAQVISVTILKPNQRVRVTLPEAGRPIRLSAAVAWATFEMPKAGPRYRAGIEFFDGDPDALGRFIDANKR